jgi:hypothetical protein
MLQCSKLFFALRASCCVAGLGLESWLVDIVCGSRLENSASFVLRISNFDSVQTSLIFGTYGALQ